MCQNRHMTAAKINPADFNAIAKINAANRQHRQAIAKAVLPNYKRRVTMACNYMVKCRNDMFYPSALEEAPETRERSLRGLFSRIETSTLHCYDIERATEWARDEVLYHIDRKVPQSLPWQRAVIWGEEMGLIEPVDTISYSKFKVWITSPTTRATIAKNRVAAYDRFSRACNKYYTAASAYETCRFIASGMTLAQYGQTQRLEQNAKHPDKTSGIDTDQAVRLFVIAQAQTLSMWLPEKFASRPSNAVDQIEDSLIA